jgi:hypothetical protein
MGLGIGSGNPVRTEPGMESPIAYEMPILKEGNRLSTAEPRRTYIH